ncbi:lipocalin family protein [Chitinophaga sp. XS-30]|uniref:lipocalin family protein n=1 Tax=Chitinophaga sp. XS-30 TaxID=2604421 RepID=UPI0011DD0AA7|nr:lipocalin family protein [Chitinophaga sp. XS-30]QEH40061.1 lipocalin family protein [Chitinophaga sp. XS-30]
MIKPGMIAGLALILAACQPKQQAANDSDSARNNSLVPSLDTGTQFPDTLKAQADTAMAEVDATLLPGKWIQPVPGIDSILQGIELRKNGKAVSVNMHTLLYDKWELSHDTLILWSHAEGVENAGPAIDTMLVRALNDTALVLFPINAAAGYLERFTRQRKGK